MTARDPARHERLQELFEQAIGVEARARAELLAKVELDDPELGGQLAGLLRAHERAGTVLDNPIGEALVRATQDPWIGARVGVYQLTRRIGAGGMGTVYEAVRADDQFKKRVAVKFLRQYAATDLAVQRFRTERQILANLNHRNIAALLDGGVMDDGQPYFVMEYVEGKPITQWSDERKLSVAMRLSLFRQVCGAVEAAHQSLVVHRDLKPGNILVAEDGTVKLLDFGIAKLLPTDEGDSATTNVGARAFTPDYASPEQIGGKPIGTPSDVYSLGVVLFELLTGSHPIDTRGSSYVEIERLVAETPAPRASDAVDRDRAPLLGDLTVNRARARLAGDLDAIIAMALRKEPARRYGSVRELARDLEAHLAGQPVLAGPDTVGYRLGKLLRRRRVEVVAAGLVAASLAGGIWATVRQARRAAAERDVATAVKDFLTTMLGAASPGALGRDVRVQEVLDSAATRAAALSDRPALKAEINTVMGHTYLALGEFPAAERQYREAVAARRLEHPDGDFAVARSLADVAGTLENQGNLDAADSVVSEALRVADRHPPGGRLDRAYLIDAHARILARLGRYNEATPLLREALRIQEEDGADDASGLAYAYGNLAHAEAELGRLEVAESLLVRALAVAPRGAGDPRPRIADALSLLAVNRERRGDWVGADSAYQAGLALRRELLGPGHPDYAMMAANYALGLVDRERFAEALQWGRDILAYRGKGLEDAHPAVSAAMQLMGKAYWGFDSLEVAGRWLTESLSVRQATRPADHWTIASSRSILGEHYVRAKRYPEAERLLVASERALVAARGEQAPVIADARQRLVTLYEAWGKPAQAASWRSKLPAGR